MKIFNLFVMYCMIIHFCEFVGIHIQMKQNVIVCYYKSLIISVRDRVSMY